VTVISVSDSFYPHAMLCTSLVFAVKSYLSVCPSVLSQPSIVETASLTVKTLSPNA